MAVHNEAKFLACPFFMPTQKHDSALWTHPARLPLGNGWTGHCTAPRHLGEIPSDEQLRESCNLGYARTCAWCPPDRPWDSTRFGVIKESDQRVTLCYVFEKEHRPVEHGSLEYDPVLRRWNSKHPDERVQRMAESYLESYLLRRNARLDLSSNPQ
jgi:hypothetical protein